MKVTDPALRYLDSLEGRALADAVKLQDEVERIKKWLPPEPPRTAYDEVLREAERIREQQARMADPLEAYLVRLKDALPVTRAVEEAERLADRSGSVTFRPGSAHAEYLAILDGQAEEQRRMMEGFAGLQSPAALALAQQVSESRSATEDLYVLLEGTEARAQLPEWITNPPRALRAPDGEDRAEEKRDRAEQLELNRKLVEAQARNNELLEKLAAVVIENGVAQRADQASAAADRELAAKDRLVNAMWRRIAVIVPTGFAAGSVIDPFFQLLSRLMH